MRGSLLPTKDGKALCLIAARYTRAIIFHHRIVAQTSRCYHDRLAKDWLLGLASVARGIGPLGHRAPCPGARRAGPRSCTPATDLVGEPLTRRGQTHPLGQVQLLVHASVHARLLLLAGCLLA